MKRIILASNNNKKIEELRSLCTHLPYKIFSLSELNFCDEIIEDGDSYQANALLKVNAVRNRFKDDIIISDDSGIEVDALNGAPGIYSARYAKTPEECIEKMLMELNGVKDRSARFRCVIALAIPNQDVKFFEGVCDGCITQEKSGVNGFGYDPIFFSYELEKVMATASRDEKASVSHRGKALRSAITYLEGIYAE